jgi:hypothetical protein
VGLTTASCKTWICLETSTEASEEEEGWGSHGPKMGRSAIEEEDNRYKRGRKRRKYVNEEYGRRRKGERRRR